MRDDSERLLDITEAIELIEKYAVQGREKFESSELVQTWVLHHIQILGEACRELSSELKTKHPEVSWSKIIGMRHILVHHYFGVDTDIVWSVVERDLPDLKRKIEVILRELGKRS